ncbi:type VII secretion target [Nocardia sp. NPDC050712]|uniref:type VII secretion target n=1 Tax=Nocardia sp. NPDC050712 TaxID=3155518 RepID=UPI0033C822FD
MQPNTTTLNRAVQDGQLWIDGVLVAEGAHEKCAQRYELLAEQVEAQIEALRAATSLPGFGGFDSGAALRTGFENKATEALTKLREYATAARELAQTFRAAAAAYQRGDEELAVAVDHLTELGAANA